MATVGVKGLNERVFERVLDFKKTLTAALVTNTTQVTTDKFALCRLWPSRRCKTE